MLSNENSAKSVKAMGGLSFHIGGGVVGREFTIGRDDSCDFVIRHNTVSRNQAVLRVLAGGAYELRDCGSKYGTFVNNARVDLKTVHQGDTIRLGTSPPFLLERDNLVQRADAVGMSVAFNGVSVVKDGQTILHRVDAEIGTDEFVAIIGPSGCGKSTLLACLTDKGDDSRTRMVSDGRITFDDGKDIGTHFDSFIEKAGVVPQGVLLFDELTVRENLTFSARIKLPGKSQEEISHLVEEAIRAVDLDQHGDRKVEILSGGQKKRVNVAVELLVRPRLLLLDEPTAGLDPDMELQVLSKLRGLSRRGMTVVCVIHATRLDIFDRVICLWAQPQKGDSMPSVIYNGPPEGLGGSIAPSAVEDEVILAQPSQTDSTGMRWHRRQTPVVLRRASPGNAYFAAQTFSVLSRSALCFRRDRQSVALSLALPLCVAVLIVVSQGEQGLSHVCFFLVISAFWMGMNSSVREIVRERRLYVRDKLNGLIPEAYLLGKALYCFFVSSAQAILLIGAAGLTIKLLVSGGTKLEILADQLHSGSRVAATVPLLAAGIGGVLTALFVSTLAATERTAVATLPLLLLPQILLSRVAYGDAGALFSKSPFGTIDALPKGGFIDWIIYLSSSGFITRPCATTMTLCIDPNTTTGSIAVEWTYLLGLTAIYVLAIVVVFIEKQKSWKDWR